MRTDNFNFRMVAIARESRGLTQKELASVAGMSQGLISRIENGLLTEVSAETIDALASALGYSVSFFSLGIEIHGIGPSLVYHRKRQNLPTKTLKRVYAQIHIIATQLSTLLRGVEIDPCKIPRINPEEYDGNIEAIARDLPHALASREEIDALGDYERCVAWAWLEYRSGV